MARLPKPGGDNGNWGDILNDYLSQAHETDGTLKDIPQAKITNLTSDLTSIQNTLTTKADASALTAKLNTTDLDTQTAAKINDNTSATAGALSATIAEGVETATAAPLALLSPAGSRGLAICGDSNSAAGVTGAGGVGVYNLLTAPLIPCENHSWVGWATLAAGGRDPIAVHAATPSITPAQWNTNFLAGVIAAAPYAAVDALGTNNVGNLAQQIAALTAMYDAFDDAGIKVIVCSIPPSTASTADVQRLNRWKRITSRERGYLFVDNYAAVVDPATGYIAAAFNSDGTHWNAAGGRAVGLAFGAAVSAVWPDVSTLAVAQPSPADLINKPLLLVKSGFVPEDWTSLGYGSASTAVETVAGVVGKMFTVTQTVDGGVST